MKAIWLAFALTVAATLGLSAPAPAQTAALTQEQLLAEYDRLFRQMLADPTNLDVTFKFAAVATRLGNYESAISALERMLLLNPDLPRVKLELGVLYFRLDALPIAKFYFEDAISGPDTPALVTNRVNAYLDEVDRRLSTSYFTGSLSFGFRGQSNANAGPASNIIRVLGIDTTLSDDFAGKPDGNLFGAGNVTHSYDIEEGILDSWQTNGTAFYTHLFTFDELDIAFGQLRTGPLLVLIEDQDDRFTVRPYLNSNVLTLGEVLNFYSYGGGVEIYKVFDTTTTVFTDLQYREQKYVDTAQRPTNDNFSNDGPVLRFIAQHFFTDDFFAGLNFTFVEENATTTFDSNTEYLIGAFAGVQYPPPMGLTDWPWRFDFSVLGIISDYDAPDPSVDPFVTRQDREYRINATNTFGFSREWSAYMQVGYSNNMSNLPNFEFNNIFGLVGVTRSFF